MNCGKNYQSLWRLWLGTKLFVIVDNPEYVKVRSTSIILIIFIKFLLFLFCFFFLFKMLLNNPNVTEKSEEYNYLKPFVANGLFTAPGEVLIFYIVYKYIIIFISNIYIYIVFFYIKFYKIEG